jgi:hypothetical protein
MAIAIAVAGFIVVGLQLNSLSFTLYPAVAALLLLVLSNAFKSRQDRIEELLKQYLEQPEKSDLQSMLRKVWEPITLRSLLGLRGKGGRSG